MKLQLHSGDILQITIIESMKSAIFVVIEVYDANLDEPEWLTIARHDLVSDVTDLTSTYYFPRLMAACRIVYESEFDTWCKVIALPQEINEDFTYLNYFKFEKLNIEGG